MTPLYYLPLNVPYVISYVSTPVHKLGSPLHSPSFFMPNISSTSTTINSVNVHTHSEIGGGTFSIPNTAPNTVFIGYTSPPSLSGGIQPSSPFTGTFSYGMSFVGFPSIPLNLPSTTLENMPSMFSIFASLQGFSFGSRHVPPSKPSLGTRIFPFPSFSKNVNMFQVQRA